MRRSYGSAVREDRTKRLRLPLMQAFREAAAAGTSRRAPQKDGDHNSLPTSHRYRSPTLGSDEVSLQRNLAIDLDRLLNTINLGASVDLTNHPAVRKSIVNYGVMDLSKLTTDSIEIGSLPAELKAALCAHEPRLEPSTLEITQIEVEGHVTQNVRLEVSAELRCEPMNLPIEFCAEIDTATGEVTLQSGTVRPAEIGPPRNSDPS